MVGLDVSLVKLCYSLFSQLALHSIKVAGVRVAITAKKKIESTKLINQLANKQFLDGSLVFIKVNLLS